MGAGAGAAVVVVVPTWGTDSRVAAAPSARPETVAPSEIGERGCAPAVAAPPAGSREPELREMRELTVESRCGSSTG